MSILTVILSFLLYYAEHDAQPELCENGWQALVWAFAKYLGDPGKIADFPLMTFWGHVIATLVGVLGICIFAVPAGLIGSGFVEVIEERRHQEKILGDAESIRHGLRWVKDQQYTNLFAVPPFIPLGNLLQKQFLPEPDVIEAVKETPNLHLYNLAKAFNNQDNPQDKIVVVGCACNRPYGCCIDRGSKVTMVSTSGYDEPITGWVAYHIAKLGGFNYVSKELESCPDNPVSYYNIPADNDDPCLKMYLEDIERLSSKEGAWIIPMCNCNGPQSREHKIHLVYSPTKGDAGYDNPDKTITDCNTFDAFANDLADVMEKVYGLKTDKNKYYAIQPTNFMYQLSCKNGFALRLECAPFYFDADKIAKIKNIADAMNRHFEPDVEKRIPEEMLVRPDQCFGFEDYKD